MTFIAQIFLKALMAILTKFLLSLASEQMLEWAFFKIAGTVVESTSTTKDNEWYEKIKEVYFSK